jgi:prepilin-type N-terminal cleavage/methylation domain-containing protein
MKTPAHHTSNPERGATLVELMIAIVVLSVGVLGVAQLFPTGTRVQVQNRIRTEASQLSREKIEQLHNVDPTDPALSVGRHPAVPEQVGSAGGLQRYYDVEAMAAPLDNLKRITVTVTWKHARACSLQAVTYLGQ